jgi:hypothetical protein
MVGQVLITVVQNSAPRSELGIAMATTSFFRGLGGAIGAAVLGSIFTAAAGGSLLAGPMHTLAGPARADLIGGVQSVFAVGSAIAALALLVVLALPELELRGRAGPAGPMRSEPGAPQTPATAH